MTKEEEYKIYKQMFNEMLSKDFHKENSAEVSTVAAKNFLLYAASVVLNRAIPDLRDGLKPSQRRSLFIMKKMGLSYSGPYRKTARITGLVIGSLHPHGDSSVYETLVNLSQSWKQNLTLVDGQGNWGSIDGDDPAAQRYTEARLTKASLLMFKDINNGVVDMKPNYDGLEKEPVVLPCPIPNILINGVLKGSVAVGMDSVILPHNSKEVINLTKAMIKSRKERKEFTVEDFFVWVEAPDFPTGGTIYNYKKSMLEIIKNGKGSLNIRANYHIETEGRKKFIVFTEIPYGKLKPKLIQEIVDLKNDKENRFSSALVNISDQSSEDIRIVIEVKNGWEVEEVVNYIFKKTAFDTTISYSTTVIDTINNKPTPRKYGLLTIMNRFLDHRFNVVKRKFTYIEEDSFKKLNIVEGLLSCIDQINEVIQVIKKSQNMNTASVNLMKIFKLNEAQAEAILNMKLSKLTSMQKKELVNKKRELKADIKYCKFILNSYENQCDYLIEELNSIDKELLKDRKTKLKNLTQKKEEFVVPKEDIIIEYSNCGYIKRVEKNKSIELQEEDFVLRTIKTNSHEDIYALTDKGSLFSIPAYKIPNSPSGSYIKNIFKTNDNIIHVFCMGREESKNLLILTKNGQIKKIKSGDLFGAKRKTGISTITLSNEDRVVMSRLITKEEDICIITRNAKSIKFSTEEISQMGKTAKGVRAIKLKEGDFVISAFLSSEDFIHIYTDNKYIRKLAAKKMNKQSRGGVGVLCMDLNKKTGHVKLILNKFENNHLNIEELPQTESKKGVFFVWGYITD